MTFLQMMQQTSIDLDCLRSFVAVADRLAFHEAASALRISASPLTRRIQRLEAALDTPLLERSTRQITPTAEGRLLLPLARTAIAAVTLPWSRCARRHGPAPATWCWPACRR